MDPFSMGLMFTPSPLMNQNIKDSLKKPKTRRKSHHFYHAHKTATKHPKSTLKRLAQGLLLKEIRKTWLPGEYDFRGVGKMKVALRKKENEKNKGFF